MTYREALTAAMDDLARDPRVYFVGYGVRHGRAMGTLANVPEAQLVEMPVAEGLMVSVAIGMSLMGLRPVVFIERCDFILNAMDAVVNHLDKAALLSRGEFKPAVILRVVVGNKLKPNFTGPPHTQDFSEPLSQMVSFPVMTCSSPATVQLCYEAAKVGFEDGESTAVFEYKDFL